MQELPARAVTLSRQVELRNDSVVKGQLDAADEGMNLTLSGASWQPLQGEAQTMDFLFIKGSHVRCGCASLPDQSKILSQAEQLRPRRRMQ